MKHNDIMARVLDNPRAVSSPPAIAASTALRLLPEEIAAGIVARRDPATHARRGRFYRHIDNAEQHGERLSQEGKGMRRDRTTSYAALTVALLGPWLCCPPTTSDDPAHAFWNGRYAFTRYLEQKSGTSLAAQQPEGNSTDVYTMSTTCSATGCVATTVDGPHYMRANLSAKAEPELPVGRLLEFPRGCRRDDGLRGNATATPVESSRPGAA